MTPASASAVPSPGPLLRYCGFAMPPGRLPAAARQLLLQRHRANLAAIRL